MTRYRKMQYHRYTPNGLTDAKEVTHSTRLILAEAMKLGIAWEEIPGTQIFELTYGEKKRAFYHQVPETSSTLSHFVTGNKNITNKLLIQAGLSVPHGFRILTTDDRGYWETVYDALGKPVVVKPTHGTQGELIQLSITSLKEYMCAVEKAFTYPNPKNTVLVEEMFDGKEYRILTTRDRVIGIANRVPANVIGDGKSTIRQLVQEKNADPRRDQTTLLGQTHVKLRLTPRVKKILEEQSYTEDSIPEKGVTVWLSRVSNTSKGGDAIDVTDQVHPSVKELALRAIRAIPGLTFAGVDFMTSDSTIQQTDETYRIIEVNDSPGIGMHDYPYEGKNRHAARGFLEVLFNENFR